MEWVVEARRLRTKGRIRGPSIGDNTRAAGIARAQFGAGYQPEPPGQERPSPRGGGNERSLRRGRTLIGQHHLPRLDTSGELEPKEVDPRRQTVTLLVAPAPAQRVASGMFHTVPGCERRGSSRADNGCSGDRGRRRARTLAARVAGEGSAPHRQVTAREADGGTPRRMYCSSLVRAASSLRSSRGRSGFGLPRPDRAEGEIRIRCAEFLHHLNDD